MTSFFVQVSVPGIQITVGRETAKTACPPTAAAGLVFPGTVPTGNAADVRSLIVRMTITTESS